VAAWSALEKQGILVVTDVSFAWSGRGLQQSMIDSLGNIYSAYKLEEEDNQRQEMSLNVCACRRFDSCKLN
jgi:hypothetical protein